MPFCVGVAIRFLSFQSLKAGSWRNYFILPLQESSLSLCLCTRVPRDSSLHPSTYLYIICLKQKKYWAATGCQASLPDFICLAAKTLPVGSKVNHPDNIFCFLMIQLLLAHCLLSSLFPHLSVWCSCSNTFINLVSPVVTYILSHVWLFATSWTTVHLAPQSLGFSWQEYWNELPFPPPGDLPNSWIEPTCLALQADSIPLSHKGSPHQLYFLSSKVFRKISECKVHITLLLGVVTARVRLNRVYCCLGNIEQYRSRMLVINRNCKKILERVEVLCHVFLFLRSSWWMDSGQVLYILEFNKHLTFLSSHFYLKMPLWSFVTFI